MKKVVFALVFTSFLSFCAVSHVQAQTQVTPLLPASPSAQATQSASATASASTDTNSSPSAEVIEKIQERKNNDITDTTGNQKDKLTTYLDENQIQSLSWNNFLQHAIRNAVKKGVPANVLVLVMLFPLIASVIAASRHVIGLRGFGIYIPAVLAVALVSTGILEGLIIFIIIVAAALLSKRILKNIKISYLPRTALLIWMISLGILAAFLLAPLINLATLMTVNIFPILILVLLSENFLDAQASTKESEALMLTIETIVLAVVSGLILRWDFMQKFALLQPELLILFTAGLNILIGKFTGLRLTEWLRFRPIIEE